MRMIFHKLCAVITALGFLTGCAQANDVGKKTTLFNGQVTFCYSESLSELVGQGRTGVFALDQVSSPSKTELNFLLEPYGHAYVKTQKGQAWWIPSGVPKWKHICRVQLPKDAHPYILGQRTSVDPDYDDSNRIDYQYLRNNPALDGYRIKERVWFNGDKLVHVEIKAIPFKSKL